jgi:hypothetical protein
MEIGHPRMHSRATLPPTGKCPSGAYLPGGNLEAMLLGVA